MRLSDILKKAKGQDAPPEPNAPQPTAPPLQHQPPAPATAPSPESGVSGEPPKDKPAPALTAEETYTKAIIEIKNIFSCAQRSENYGGNLESVTAVIDCLRAKSDEILILVDRATPDVYLYGHSVNVCILSVMLAQAVGMEPASLSTLGIAALLHDLGLAKNMSIVLKGGKLAPAEFSQIKKHSVEGGRLVALISALSDKQKEDVAGIILQIHERNNGTGYPGALRGEEITACASIIAIADVYETMSHPRPYQERAIPHEALKSLIAAANNEFDTEILKTFIGRLSLYPPGSYVKINTDEIARVVGINTGMPTRPTVKILIGPDRRRAVETKIIDLSATPMLFVKEAVDESKLNLADKKLSIELKAVRWWVKGL